LRSQRVHLLRAAQLTRQRVHREHGDFARGELLHQFRILRRPDERNECGAFAQQGDFLVARGAYLEHDVGSGKKFGGVGCNGGAGGAISVIATVGGIARASFNRDLEAQLDQLLHDLGNGRNPFFSRQGFPWHSDCQ